MVVPPAREPMAQETELKLSLHPQDLPRLLAHPLLRSGARPGQRLLNTYFDTPALELRAARMAVRERRVGARTLLTVKTAGSSVGGLSRRGEWEVPRPRGALRFARFVDDAALARQLDAWAGALVPVFHTDFTRRTWLVSHAGARIEIALDQGELRSGSGSAVRRAPLLEFELELLDGPVDALLDLAHTLVLGPDGHHDRALRLRPAQRSKAERGYALFQGERPAPHKAAPIALHDAMPVREACRLACLAALQHLQANEEGLLDAARDARQLPDPEFVHQARVALRRLRTGLRLFRAQLPADWVRYWSTHWKELAHVLGAARNWDVFDTEALPTLLPEPDARADAAALRAWVRAQRQAAQRAAVAALAAPDHALAVLAFTRSLLALPVAGRAPAGGLSAWARAHLHDGHARLREQAREARRLGPEGRHELRLALKRLRYTQEFLSGVLPPRRAARSTAGLAEAQALLGELNDLSTAQALLQQAPAGLAPALVAALQTGLQAQLDAGLLALPTLERSLERAPLPW
ncbi:CYTH and CHAD domain-containing protein [Hydrogenophaga crocea]|uniref:CHAD domain-containing protein n=1 Tax=Hydrogenophaga crocea TaxID=2716225 RepID=A0A6G8IJP8_9BURK|nr:CYTH and CHAD domain-containing protein [Hydrogenophaga crocea]QIM53303.1 CHAD domain-containing protein [Hydrogenophaga crocea]